MGRLQNNRAMKLGSLLVLLLIPAISPLATAAEIPRLDLNGRVLNQSGAPVPGVTVMILAAGPRTGSSSLCPYTYPDCGKKTVSDAKGNFRIPSLDPVLDFCIIALAPGCEPFYNSKIIPEAGLCMVKLRPRDLSKIPPNHHVCGRIIGPDGRGVAGAILDVDGLEQGDLTSWGGNDATEGMAMTDTNGEFHVIGHKDFTAIFCVLETNSLARRWARLEPGKTLLLRMTAGAAIHGRLVWKGQPLAGVALGMCTKERECGKYFNGLEAVTDKDGKFVFEHVPPAMTYELFGKMISLAARGVAFQHQFDAAPEGGTTDLGELNAEPAHRLSGRILLSDGKPVPPGIRLMLDRAGAWDTTLAQLDEHGAFELTGIPSEKISLYVTVPGYRFSEKNPNLDLNRRSSLIGRVSADITGLDILLEPGSRPNWNDIDHPSFEEEQKAGQMPLHGTRLQTD